MGWAANSTNLAIQHSTARSVLLYWNKGLLVVQIFQLMWRMVQYDVQFVWERLEYLTNESDETLSEVPFKVSVYGVT